MSTTSSPPPASGSEYAPPSAAAPEAKVKCRRKRPAKSSKKIPPEVRLNYHREVPIERLKSGIPKPHGYLPPSFLPNWPQIPMEAKLPSMILPSEIYFLTRGHLGQRLYHNPKYYTVYDPYNQERVIKEEYNALHDPHSKNYWKKTSVQKHLLKQGLITTKGQVLCKLKEFNMYRKYLSTLYNDDVVNKLKEQHIRELELHKNDLELKQYFERSDERSHFNKIQNAKIRQRQIYEDRVQKIEERQKTAEEREERQKQELLEKRFTKQMLAYEADEARRLRLAEFKKSQQERQAQLYTLQIYKENMTVERVKQFKASKAEEKRQFMLKWMDSKWNFQLARLQKEATVKEAIQSDFVQKAARRQRAVEHYRSILPQIVEKQKKEKERIWNLVKKFFYRWLNKVRERKARVPDAEHQSLWDITAQAQETVHYLHKESGYEKLDDLIMGILKLKRDIKAELEREAAAEEALEAEEDAEAEEEAASRRQTKLGDRTKQSVIKPSVGVRPQ